jgi:hypothetical protein
MQDNPGPQVPSTSSGDEPCRRLLPKDARRLLSLGRLVDQLVEVADPTHQGIGDVLHAHTAHHVVVLAVAVVVAAAYQSDQVSLTRGREAVTSRGTTHAETG